MKPAVLTPCFPAAPVRRLACGLWLFAASAAGAAPEAPVGTPPAAPAPSAPAQASSPSNRPLPETLRSALQNGLFEEEANRDYDKAIAAYREALNLYDIQRPSAGTVLYRLAECLRKKGQPAEAIPLYRRVLAEFPADTGLCSDARRRLTELNAGIGAGPEDAANGPSQEEINTLADLKVLAERSPEMLPLRAKRYFVWAAQKNYLEVLKFFVEHQVKDLDFERAIQQAVVQGSLPVVRFLLESDPGPKSLAEPLRQTAQDGNLALMDCLLQHGADVKKDGAPALIAAIIKSRTAAVYKLIDAGTDLNTAVDGSDDDASGRLRPLAWALDQLDEPLARYLVNKGARCDLPSERRQTAGTYPLHAAWNADLTRFLLEHGADREARDGEGKTPVLKAAGLGYFDVAETLIAAGADVTAKDREEGTLIHYLTSGIRSHPAFSDSANPSFEFQGKILLKDDPRLPELRIAAVRILDAAVKAGVPINGVHSADRKIAGMNPLANACKWVATPAQTEFLERLIERGADVNFADDDGVTPLHTAALRRSESLLEVLLRHGANPMAETSVQLEIKINSQSGEAYLESPNRHFPGRPTSIIPSRLNPADPDFFRYRPLHLIGVLSDPASGRNAVLRLARATYARDFEDRDTAVWQEYSILSPWHYNADPSIRKIADPALDGQTPVNLLEAVMRADPGLEANGAPEIHILRRRANDEREAEDIVYDLNALMAASPAAFPELRPGDVLLLLPRSSRNEESSPIGAVWEPLPRNLALALEEKKPMKISLTVPENHSASELGGDWQVFRPLVSKAWTDTVRHTSWTGLSLRMLVNPVRNFPSLDQESKNPLQLCMERRLTPVQIIRGDGRTVIKPAALKSAAGLFLRDGDRIEFISDPAAAETGPVQGNSQPGGALPFPNDGFPPRRKVVLPAQQ